MQHVYIISNPCMPGLVKVGMTKNPVDQRVASLSASSSIPLPFILEEFVTVDDAALIERVAHRYLRKHRVNNRREFFRCSPRHAYDAVIKACESMSMDMQPDIPYRSGMNCKLIGIAEWRDTKALARY